MSDNLVRLLIECSMIFSKGRYFWKLMLAALKKRLIDEFYKHPRDPGLFRWTEDGGKAECHLEAGFARKSNGCGVNGVIYVEWDIKESAS